VIGHLTSRQCLQKISSGVTIGSLALTTSLPAPESKAFQIRTSHRPPGLDCRDRAMWDRPRSSVNQQNVELATPARHLDPESNRAVLCSNPPIFRPPLSSTERYQRSTKTLDFSGPSDHGLRCQPTQVHREPFSIYRPLKALSLLIQGSPGDNTADRHPGLREILSLSNSSIPAIPPGAKAPNRPPRLRRLGHSAFHLEIGAKKRQQRRRFRVEGVAVWPFRGSQPAGIRGAHRTRSWRPGRSAGPSALGRLSNRFDTLRRTLIAYHM